MSWSLSNISSADCSGFCGTVDCPGTSRSSTVSDSSGGSVFLEFPCSAVSFCAASLEAASAFEVLSPVNASATAVIGSMVITINTANSILIILCFIHSPPVKTFCILGDRRYPKSISIIKEY